MPIATPIKTPDTDGAPNPGVERRTGLSFGDRCRPRTCPAGLVGALLAFCDDVLESGDARLALDRPFRWGYREPDGERVGGLQERVQDLRHQRDRLLRRAEDPAFLEDLRPDRDRLDALDGVEGVKG